jgi:RND family efflux transporter MFP subunit
MMRPLNLILMCFLLSSLVGCFQAKTAPNAADGKPRLVYTVALEPSDSQTMRLSGVLKPHKETPMAFQVSGRIKTRVVDAGETVKPGQTLWTLDDRDVQQQLQTAKAQQTAATAALATASAELKRLQALQQQGYISAQGVERALLQFNQATAELEASEARLQQAHLALSYTKLIAPEAGVIQQILAEAGHVVAAGQPLAVLASSSPPDIVVQLPQRISPPDNATLRWGQDRIKLTLRNFEAMSDSRSLTRQARYRLPEWPLTTTASLGADQPALNFGQIVQVEIPVPDAQTRSYQIGDTTHAALSRLETTTGNDKAKTATAMVMTEMVMKVPISAIDERGHQPQIWHIKDGKAQPSAVNVLQLSEDYALITTNLAVKSKVIRLGVHVLEPGMAVMEWQP